jgi:hypothetical protein
VGATGVLVVTATVTGLTALSASNTMKDTRFVGDSPSSDVSSASSRAKTFALVTDFVGIAAIGTLATTLVLTYTRNPRAEEPKTSFAIGPTGVSLRGRF